MKYDEDLLIELIAEDRLSHSEIAEKVGVSRRTVWRIANGQSRPDLQKKLSAVAEGYRQAVIRLAAKHMEKLLKKQMKVALEEDGETARKSREFLLKTFMLTIPDQTARAEEKQREQDAAAEERKKKQKAEENSGCMTVPLTDLSGFSPELQKSIVDELLDPERTCGHNVMRENYHKQ